MLHVYIVSIYSKFGSSHEIFSYNGTEFKKKLFVQAASTLGMKQVFCSPYYPQGNRHIENVQYFVKMCIWNHVSSKLAWNAVTHISYLAYNFVLNEHSKESKFLLICRCGIYTQWVQLQIHNIDVWVMIRDPWSGFSLRYLCTSTS